MENLVITLSRQFGSLGRPIAKRMSELMNIEFYDRDIVEKTAQKMDLSVKEVSKNEESASIPFFNMKFPLGSGTSATQDKIFQTQCGIINELADKESCIIVGRCSDYVLRNRKNCIKIFIFAPFEERLKNCLDYLHMEEADARKMIAEVDKARDRYHMHYAKYLPSDFQHEDILINSSLLGVEGTAKELVHIIKERFE